MAALLLAVSCRLPIPVDTSQAKFIPREVALDELKGLLPTAERVGCSLPRGSFARTDVREWKIEDGGVEFKVEGREPFRFTFAEISSTRLDQLQLLYQVRVFAPAQPNVRKELFHFDWKEETPARRAIELLDALRHKPE